MPIFRKLDKEFFELWSYDMAYILGFFAADGSMIINKRGAHYIDFHITDKDLLYKIRKAFKSNHKIKRQKQNEKWHDSYHLQIGSKQMFYDLKELGFTQRKSKTLQMPKIPQKYFSNFTRGYFDGDGTVVYSQYFCKARNKYRKYLQCGFISGSETFLQALSNRLKKETSILGGSLHLLKGGYRLFYSTRDTLKLYHFMYDNLDSNLFLKRKQKIFQKYIRFGGVVG